MNATGNRPPLQIKSKFSLLPLLAKSKSFDTDKGEYIGKQQQRWVKSFNIPMAEKNPPGFPHNTIKVRI